LPSLFDIFFYLFAAAIVASAAVVCFSRNIVHAAFSLLFTFFGVAGIYVLLSADFLAVGQILIYVGGILVLLVFGVMLTNRVTNIDLRSALGARIPALIICGALLALLISILLPGHWISFREVPWKGSPWNHDAVAQVTAATQGTARELLDHQGSKGTALEIGKLLMTDYLLPFELVSIVLMVALIGAAMIARQDSNPSMRYKPRYKEPVQGEISS
jgi:NADH-quinone oxidoreductase subunit J